MVSHLKMNVNNIHTDKSKNKIKLANIVLIIITVICLCLTIIVTISAISGIDLDAMTTVEFGNETESIQFDNEDMDMIDTDEYLYEFKSIDTDKNSEFLNNYGG